MLYEYQDLQYEKRAITDHVVVQVIDNSYEAVKQKAPLYSEKAANMKNAEAAGQADACPVFGRDELKAATGILRKTVEGFRFRSAQLGTAVSVEQLEAVTGEDALFQIANGTTINFAVSYSADAVDTLLAGGVLPLVTEKPIEAGTYIGILNIRAALEQGKKELDAYVVTEGSKEPIVIKTADFTVQQLDKILN